MSFLGPRVSSTVRSTNCPFPVRRTSCFLSKARRTSRLSGPHQRQISSAECFPDDAWIAAPISSAVQPSGCRLSSSRAASWRGAVRPIGFAPPSRVSCSIAVTSAHTLERTEAKAPTPYPARSHTRRQAAAPAMLKPDQPESREARTTPTCRRRSASLRDPATDGRASRAGRASRETRAGAHTSHPCASQETTELGRLPAERDIRQRGRLPARQVSDHHSDRRLRVLGDDPPAYPFAYRARHGIAQGGVPS